MQGGGWFSPHFFRHFESKISKAAILAFNLQEHIDKIKSNTPEASDKEEKGPREANYSGGG